MQTFKTTPSVDTYRKIACRYCNTKLPDTFLDLGTMALANSFIAPNQKGTKEFACPLSLAWCEICKLVQLSYVVPPEKMFSNYLYVSSTTKTFQDHFFNYAKTVKTRLDSKDLLAVDIGSNDGLLLSCYQKVGMRAVGVDPAKNLSDDANQRGLPTINRFFDSACVKEIIDTYGKADVVSANNVFAHIDDVKSVCQNVFKLLNEEGLFVIEFPYLVAMFEDMFFDMIYHEHLSYISITALNYLMKSQGFKIVAIEKVTSHGGSLRVFLTKVSSKRDISQEVGSFLEDEEQKGYLKSAVYQEFAKQVENVKMSLNQFVQKITSEGKTISGYGAPAKASTLINYCGFNSSHIKFIIDDNPLKQNTFSPGANIRIVPSLYLNEHPTDYVMIFAWNFANEIMKKIEHLRERGVKFLIPLPHPKIV